MASVGVSSYLFGHDGVAVGGAFGHRHECSVELRGCSVELRGLCSLHTEDDLVANVTPQRIRARIQL